MKAPADEKQTTQHYDMQLRGVDLNLLTVFNAVMKEQNITRAAKSLGMSQPAVSNAVSRLKVMFNDELFIRSGRGIQATLRAHQLYRVIHQALQLIQNELPGGRFEAANSQREFLLAIASPLDIKVSKSILALMPVIAPHVNITFLPYSVEEIRQQLRYQQLDMVIGYHSFEDGEFIDQALSEEPLVLVASEHHPRLSKEMREISEEQLLCEHHAAVKLAPSGSFSYEVYKSSPLRGQVRMQCGDIFTLLHNVVGSELVAIVPRWLAIEQQGLGLRYLALPRSYRLNCYLSWHDSAKRDQGHQWLRDLLCQTTLISHGDERSYSN